MEKFATDSVLESAKTVHKTRYLYSKFEYVNKRTKAIVTCRIHGDFETLPLNHARGSNCNKCAHITMRRAQGWVGRLGVRGGRSSFKAFKRKCKKYKIQKTLTEVRGTRYDYSKVIPVTNEETMKIEIVCKEHGSFWQTPKAHKAGNNCPKCANTYLGLNNIVTKCNKGHTYTRTHSDYFTLGKRCPTCNGGMYRPVEEVAKVLASAGLQLLTNGPFKRGAENIVYNCPIHGKIKKTLTRAMARPYCGKCNAQGFKVHLPGYLYYLSINNGQAYKIGVTNRNVATRYSKTDRHKIIVLKEWYFEDGNQCLQKEQEILKEFKTSKYTGDSLLRNGNTELFRTDILGLDTSIDIVTPKMEK